jgi:Cu-Zn family superoxide dismutase
MINNNTHNNCINCVSIPGNRPAARAAIKGSAQYPDIYGYVHFYQTEMGVMVVAEIFGLPIPANPCESPVFGFHIHSGGSCTGTETDPFADTMTHYNPKNCPHPYHAGDMPPLFGNQGYAFLMFLTNRFTVREIIGTTVIIHDKPDDFTTQPSGNSGNKIACGVIQK